MTVKWNSSNSPIADILRYFRRESCPASSPKQIHKPHACITRLRMVQHCDLSPSNSIASFLPPPKPAICETSHATQGCVLLHASAVVPPYLISLFLVPSQTFLFRKQRAIPKLHSTLVSSSSLQASKQKSHTHLHSALVSFLSPNTLFVPV